MVRAATGRLLDLTPSFEDLPAPDLVVAAEAGFGVMLLGKLFERFDVSEEPAN